MRLNFLTTNWVTSHSGIEQAIKQRVHLFEKHNLPYRLITVEHDINLHKWLKCDDINEKNTINLFDYFAGDTETNEKKYNFKELKESLPDNIETEIESETCLLGILDGKQIFRAYLSNPQGTMNQIDIYRQNSYKNKKVIWFDSRGWPAKITNYDTAENITFEQLLNSKGKVYYQAQYKRNEVTHEDEKLVQQLFWRGHVFTFDGDNSLFSFFYDCLVYESKDKEILLVDRTNELDYPVLNMTQPVAKYMYLHSDHVNSHNVIQEKNIDDELNGSLNPNYQYALNHIEKWDGILMPTAWQKEILLRRYPKNTKTYVIPVGYIPEGSVKKVKWEKRKPYRVICMSRLAVEKSLDDLIHAFQIVALTYPQAQLEFWGFDAGEKRFLEHEVKQCKLESNVSFKGYTTNPDKVYDSAQIAVLPSHNEGFSLSLMESIAHGVPTITYKAYYGSKSIVDDGKDGFLAEQGNINQISMDMLKLLKDQELAKKFSENAYRLSKKYSESSILGRWKRFLNSAKKVAERKPKVKRQNVNKKRLG